LTPSEAEVGSNGSGMRTVGGCNGGAYWVAKVTRRDGVCPGTEIAKDRQLEKVNSHLQLKYGDLFRLPK